MKEILYTLFILALNFNGFSQDHYEKKYTLGQQSGGKWYKLASIDLNGNGNYNSINMTVNLGYVNTFTKYNSTAILRFREGPNNSTADFQNTVSGTNSSVIKLKKTGVKTYELLGYSNGGWGHMSFTSIVTKEAPFIISIPETTTVVDVNQFEDVVVKGDWYFPSGRIEISQDDNPSEDKGLLITEKNNSQKISLHLADNASGEYGYLSLGGQTSLRGNGKPSYLEGFVGIGTTKSDGYKLAVNGKIRATEIKVETGWADYVFKEDYNLPTLSQVENHIKENGHLLNIPSATEVEENGIELGEMNLKLLEKIEELTLYTIEQEKKLQEQQTINQKLDSKNSELEARLVKIEELLLRE